MDGVIGARWTVDATFLAAGLLRALLASSLLALAAGPPPLLATDLAPGGPVALSEIQYNPPPDLGPDERYEFVELHNRRPEPVDVSGWRLKDQDDDHTFEIPAGTSIPPHGYLVVARDAAALRAAYDGGLTVVGDFDFGLANGGDTVRLMNARGELVDRVEYDDDAPWPSEADGAGASLERVSSADDITDFTNFQPSRPGSPPGTPGEPNSRAGEIPARHDVVWNEIMFHAVKDPSAETLQHCVAEEFLELYNRGPRAVDLSGWKVADGVDFVFPAGTVLGPASYLVLYKDEAAFREAYGDAAEAVGPYTKELDNGGEALLLVDDAGRPVDYVAYDDRPPWPVNPDGLSGSLELIDAFSDNDRAQAWRESDSFRGTPGARNSATTRLRAGERGSPPQITRVTASPRADPARENILSTDAVEVRARVRDADGIGAVRLEYQVIRPGDYISRTDPRFETEWTSVEMTYDGERELYAAVVPALPHRTLVRYRIAASDAAAAAAETWAPHQRDPEPNFGYYVYDGVPDYVARRRSGFGDPGFTHRGLANVPVYHIIMDRDDFDEVMYVKRDPEDNTYSWRVTFVYEGRVHDHCGVRLRGSETSRYGAPKRSWKVRFNKGNRFRGRYNDGTVYPNRRARLNLNRGVAAGIVEKLAHQLHYDAGVLSPLATLVHVRMVTSEDEHEQFEGDFFGLFAEVQSIDKVLLRDQARSLAEASSLYKMKGFPNKKHADCDLSTADYEQFNSESRSHSDREWFEQHLNLRRYFSFRAAIELTNNHDMDGQKNLGYYFDSESGLWELLPWDVECSFREDPCSGEEPLALRVPRLFDIEYRNRYRLIWQVHFDRARMLGMLEALKESVGELADADLDRWAREPRLACPSCSDGRYPAAPFEERVAWIGEYIDRRIPRAVREFSDIEVPLTPRNRLPFEGMRPAPPVRLTTFPFVDHEDDRHAATHWMLIERGGDWANPLWESETESGLEEVLVPAEVTVPGGEYLFRAAHIDSTGRRSFLSSPTAFRVGPTDPTPPSAPVDLEVEHAGWRSVALRWTASVDPESGIAGYRILRDGESLAGHLIAVPRTTDFTPPSGRSRYRVVAVNAAGVESAPSAAVDVDVPAGGLGGWRLPAAGWTYLFDARPGETLYSDPQTEGQPVYLDGRWRRSPSRNDWDGGAPGDGEGAPGGVAVESVGGAAEDGGSASVLSLEDPESSQHPANRRLVFLHDAGNVDFVEDGITLIARFRVHPSPVDLPGPKSQAPDSSLRGQIGVGQRTGARGHFALWLDDGRLMTLGAGSVPVDVTSFQSVWLVVENAAAAGHRVRVFLNGDSTPAIDALVALSTRGTESGFERSYLEMGLGNLEDSGAIQIDFIGYTAGVHLPVTADGRPPASFIRGDFNVDGRIDIGDPVQILLHVFAGFPSACDDAGDFDDNERLDVADALFGLDFLFRRGVAPAAPFPAPGEDPRGDGPLGCEAGLETH